METFLLKGDLTGFVRWVTEHNFVSHNVQFDGVRDGNPIGGRYPRQFGKNESLEGTCSALYAVGRDGTNFTWVFLEHHPLKDVVAAAEAAGVLFNDTSV